MSRHPISRLRPRRFSGILAICLGLLLFAGSASSQYTEEELRPDPRNFVDCLKLRDVLTDVPPFDQADMKQLNAAVEHDKLFANLAGTAAFRRWQIEAELLPLLAKAEAKSAVKFGLVDQLIPVAFTSTSSAKTCMHQGCKLDIWLRRRVDPERDYKRVHSGLQVNNLSSVEMTVEYSIGDDPLAGNLYMWPTRGRTNSLQVNGANKSVMLYLDFATRFCAGEAGETACRVFDATAEPYEIPVVEQTKNVEYVVVVDDDVQRSSCK